MCECGKLPVAPPSVQSRHDMMEVLESIAKDKRVDPEIRVKAATAVLYELKPKTTYTSYGSTIPVPLAGPTYTGGGVIAVPSQVSEDA